MVESDRSTGHRGIPATRLRTVFAFLVIAAVLAGCAGAGVSPATSPSPTGAPPAISPTPSSTATTPGSPSPEASPMPSPTPESSAAPLALTSAAFAEGEAIPREHTCKGADTSPPLSWTGVPAGAKALVLFVDDPDGRDWVHWSVLDLSPSDGTLPVGVAPAGPPQQGRNDFGKVGYGGPCPPSGTHHYRFTLYALAAPLGLAGHPGGKEVRAALVKATVLAKVTLTGTFRA